MPTLRNTIATTAILEAGRKSLHENRGVEVSKRTDSVAVGPLVVQSGLVARFPRSVLAVQLTGMKPITLHQSGSRIPQSAWLIQNPEGGSETIGTFSDSLPAACHLLHSQPAE